MLLQVCPRHWDTYTNPDKYKITCPAPLASFAVMLAFLRQVGITAEQVLVIEVQWEPSDWSEMFDWAIEQSRRVNKVLLEIALEQGVITRACPIMGCGTTFAGKEVKALWEAAGLEGRFGTCYHPSPQWVKWLWRAVSALWTLRDLVQSETPLCELVDGARRDFFPSGSRGRSANTMTNALLQKIDQGQTTAAAQRDQGWRVALGKAPTFRRTNNRRGAPLDVPRDWTRRKEWVDGTPEFLLAEAMFREVEKRAVVVVEREAALADAALAFLARHQAGASSSPYIGYTQAERGHATAAAAAAAAAEARAAKAQAAAAALPAAVALPAAAAMPATEVEAAGAAAGSGHGGGSADDPVLC